MLSGNLSHNTATSAAFFIALARDISTARAGGGGFATGTTLLGGVTTVGANLRANIVASTSPAGGDPYVFGPGDFFMAKAYGGANNGAYDFTGYCEAVFLKH